MQLLTVTQLPGDIARAGEVVAVLIKYGLAGWLRDTEWEPARRVLTSHSGEVLTDQHFPTRLRLALSDLGPTFIKLGQVLSTRPDLVGPELARELSKLQSGVAGDPAETAKATVEAELARPIEECFKEFDAEPMASASIGQVHHARLKNGRQVVVKVQHPGIEAKVRRDLDILLSLAALAERRPELRRFQPLAVVREFRQTMLRELDFRREMRNLQQFRRNFADDPVVVFPKPYADFTTSRVLTMELLKGVSVLDADRLRHQRIDREEMARRGANVFVQMIFRDGLYHADPHPGNILLMQGGKIGMLDCGMTGRMDGQLREQIAEMLLAAADRDAEQLTDVICRICSAPAGLDRAGLSSELMELFTQFGTVSIDQFDVSGALTSVTRIMHDYQLLMPSRLSMLIKVLIMLEGTGKALSPHFNLAEVLEPYRRKFIMQQFSPAARLRKVRRLYRDWERLAETVPRDLTELLNSLQAGKLSLRLRHRQLEPSVNRLVYALITSALLIGSTVLWSQRAPPQVHGISILGALGYALALAMGARVLWSIFRSGGLRNSKQD